MWSLGCIFAEMIIGHPIFPGTSTLNQLERVIEKIGFPNEAERKALETQYSNMLRSDHRPRVSAPQWRELLLCAARCNLVRLAADHVGARGAVDRRRGHTTRILRPVPHRGHRAQVARG